MYKVERGDDKIIIRSAMKNSAVFIAHPDSLIIYETPNGTEISKVKDLNDESLLLALVRIVEIKAFNG